MNYIFYNLLKMSILSMQRISGERYKCLTTSMQFIEVERSKSSKRWTNVSSFNGVFYIFGTLDILLFEDTRTRLITNELKNQYDKLRLITEHVVIDIINYAIKLMIVEANI